MKVKVQSWEIEGGAGAEYGTVRVIVDGQPFDYSRSMLNPYQLVGLLQHLGHEVDWDKQSPGAFNRTT